MHGFGTDFEKMPGHWLLASLGKKMLAPETRAYRRDVEDPRMDPTAGGTGVLPSNWSGRRRCICCIRNGCSKTKAFKACWCRPCGGSSSNTGNTCRRSASLPGRDTSKTGCRHRHPVSCCYFPLIIRLPAAPTLSSPPTLPTGDFGRSPDCRPPPRDRPT